MTRADVGRARALLDAADLAILDAEETLRRTRRTLGTLLNLPPDQAERRAGPRHDRRPRPAAAPVRRARRGSP